MLALVGDMDGCSLWRVLQPITELQRRGYPADWDNRDNDKLASIVHRYNAILLPRLHWPRHERPRAERWFEALHNAGLAVIYEVDDDLLSNDFAQRLIDVHGKTQEQADDITSGIRHTLNMVDGITVSSERLKRLVQRYADKPIQVVPNAIDLEWFRSVQAKAERRVKGLTIGWAGGARPDDDVEQMAIAWGRIAAHHPDVSFVVIGHQPQVIYDNVPHERLTAVEWHPIETYPMPLVNIDIGCCPLADNGFNRSKTWIKALEYAASGAAVVASPTVYSDILDDGYDALICHTAGQWEAALTELVTSANTRKRMAQRLLNKTERRYSLAANALNWPAAWGVIFDEFQERRRRRPLIAVPNWTRHERVAA